MNARLRKVTRNRGQFPTEQSVLKVLYLAVRNRRAVVPQLRRAAAYFAKDISPK